MSQINPYQVVVLAPVYDDAAAAAQLLAHLAHAFAKADVHLQVLLVDDGSPLALDQQLPTQVGVSVRVLRLKRNFGHQRAIALGAAYVHQHLPCDALVVMDADGEDRPEDAVRLVERCRERAGERVIFAERARRSESGWFQIFYRCYQLLHWILVGIRVQVGNFSVVPAARLGALVSLPALWNHYAAAIFQSRLPRELLPTVRAPRYAGQSKMNFVALVMHGLQAISVFNEVVTVRLLLSICFFAGGCAALLGLTLFAPWITALSLPTWVPYALGALLLGSVCLAIGSFSLTLGFLANRNSLNFIPSRDYHLFVENLDPRAALEDCAASSNAWGEHKLRVVNAPHFAP